MLSTASCTTTVTWTDATLFLAEMVIATGVVEAVTVAGVQTVAVTSQVPAHKSPVDETETVVGLLEL